MSEAHGITAIQIRDFRDVVNQSRLDAGRLTLTEDQYFQGLYIWFKHKTPLTCLQFMTKYDPSVSYLPMKEHRP